MWQDQEYSNSVINFASTWNFVHLPCTSHLTLSNTLPLSLNHTYRISLRNCFYCAISFWKINICSCLCSAFSSFPTEISKNEKRNRPSNIHSRYFRMVEIFEDDLTQLSYSAVKMHRTRGQWLMSYQWLSRD